KVVENFENPKISADILQKMTVWHGSPYDFTSFDHANMGRGEGNQAHGYETYVNRTQFLKTTNGEVYGFVKDGVVYLDPDMMSADVPIHEYGHLWDNALMRRNPEMWARWKDLVRGTKLWADVLADENYADIRDNEDLVASEVKSRLSGAEGERLLAELESEAESANNPNERESQLGLVARIKALLTEMWEHTKRWLAESDVFRDEFSKEQIMSMDVRDFVRKTLRDLAQEVKPVVDGKGKNIQFRFVGEKGAANADKAEGTTVRMDNLKVAKEMENPKGKDDLKNGILSLFKSAARGDISGKPIAFGVLTDNGREFLENVSGLILKQNVRFVLNPSDLAHINNNHYGDNEKDMGNNIPLTENDIRKIVDVVEQPDHVMYVKDKGGRKVFLFIKADGKNGAYNMAEVYSDRHGNLTTKSFYKTRKGVSQRVMALRPELSTSETDGATLSAANIGILFDMHKGFGPKIIKLATGWERGKDGEWRYEEADMLEDVKVSDIETLDPMLIKDAPPSETINSTLGKLLGKSNPLFDSYPELASLPVMYADDRIMRGAMGACSTINGERAILLNENIKGTIYTLEGHIKLLRRNIKELEDELAEIGTEHWRRRREWLELDTDADKVKDETIKDIKKNKSKLDDKEGKLVQEKENVGKYVRGTLAHEIQHIIQSIEGFARGGTANTYRDTLDALLPKHDVWKWRNELEDKSKEMPDASPIDVYKALRDEYMDDGFTPGDGMMPTLNQMDNGFNLWVRGYDNEGYEDAYNRFLELATKHGLNGEDSYRRLAGEVEARNVERRLGLSDAMRRRSLASQTEDVPRDEQIVLHGNGTNLSLGDPAETFEERQRRAVENKGTVMPGLNDAEVKIVDVPGHKYTGDIKEATRQASEAAKAKYTSNGKPVTLDYDNHGTSFQYEISGNAIDEALNPRQAGKSNNKGAHLSLIEHLDEIIGESIEVEEHPDYIVKDKGGNRTTEKANGDALMHRFYGVANIDGKPYSVMTIMREDRRPDESNGIHAYEVTKVKLLDNEPGNSSGTGTLHEPVSVAKLLQNVEKSYDKGKKILDESKKASEIPSGTRYSVAEEGGGSMEMAVTEGLMKLADQHRNNMQLRMDAMQSIGEQIAKMQRHLTRVEKELKRRKRVDGKLQPVYATEEEKRQREAEMNQRLIDEHKL
ncbi:MAG: hypothetical protein HUK11_02800, partial [Muribaculaceae bacterium]|nr:hypothetical protein [Muribaculaceae bacterium]